MAQHHHNDKCSICGENEALIFVKVMIEESIEEKGLCASCAIKYMENKDNFKKLDFVDQRIVDALEEMRSLLTSIVSNINVISSIQATQTNKNNPQKTRIKCGNCGLTYENFKESGFFGCSYCYQAFREHIRELILEIERGGVHKGRMPKKFAKLFLLKKEVQFLRNQLKKSVISENYEQADKIKKKLEKLIGSSSIGKEDEID
jgi:protein arginine kinase activator